MSRLKEIWNDKDRRRGLIGTTIVHLFLLFALFFMALRTPLPLPGEEGVEVNLGYTETGYGEIQSDQPAPVSDPTPPPPQQQQPVYEEPEPEPIAEKIITQDIEEAPIIEEEVKKDEPEEKKPEEIIEKKKDPKPVIKEVPKEVKDQPVDSTVISDSQEKVDEPVEDPKPVVNKKAMYPGSSKTSTSGTNQGNTQGAGDMGKPEGYKDSDGYDGQGGKGNGPSYGLGGRGMVYLDQPNKDFNEIGEVKISITVDRQGNVVKAVIDYSGTNILDQQQRKLAIDAAMNSKFEKDPNAAESDRGFILYKFIK